MKKILIVEDEVTTVFLLRNYIVKIGHTIVDLVSNGIDAIKAVKEHNPDIILMDINLDKQFDGIETMAFVRNFSTIPVIYISAFVDMNTKQRATNIINSQILEKPIDIQQLKKAIEDLQISKTL